MIKDGGASPPLWYKNLHQRPFWPVPWRIRLMENYLVLMLLPLFPVTFPNNAGELFVPQGRGRATSALYHPRRCTYVAKRFIIYIYLLSQGWRNYRCLSCYLLAVWFTRTPDKTLIAEVQWHTKILFGEIRCSPAY